MIALDANRIFVWPLIEFVCLMDGVYFASRSFNTHLFLDFQTKHHIKKLFIVYGNYAILIGIKLSE